MRYIGIDVGKWKCRVAVMDPAGTIIEEYTFPNDAESIRDLASRLDVPGSCVPRAFSWCL